MSTSSDQINIDIPEAFAFLFEQARYKVAYGGRGSAKSWSFARALLVMAYATRTRILCAREIQKSIKTSVHRLLADQVDAMGMSSFFQILETGIRGVNGSEYFFTGLQDHTIDSIKSFEGCDIVWCEEAQTVSKRSWDILIPTIRKAGSEIWVSFNPELDTDDTYKRFVINPPPDSIVREVNYYDNPHFNDVLEQERAHCEATDPDSYPTIWLGKCRSAVIGAVYAKEVDAVIRDHRIAFLPYDPSLKVHCIWDLGWGDSMAIGFVQVMRSEIRIIDYIEDDHKTLDWYVHEIRNRAYNYAYDYIPHDGTHGDFKTGLSTETILRKLGRKVKITPMIPVDTGIHMTRMLFPRMIFDKVKTERLVECAKRYRRAINRTTQAEGRPVHDEFSHGADMLRYLAVNAQDMSNDDDGPIIVTPRNPSVPNMGY